MTPSTVGRTTRRRLGELLIEDGLLSPENLLRALELQRLGREPLKLGTVLLERDLIAEESLLKTLSKLHRCDSVAWTTLLTAGIEVVRLLPAEHAIRLAALPFEFDRGALRVAFVNPSDLLAIDEVSSHTGRRVLPAVTTELRLLQAQQHFLGRHLPLELRKIAQQLERKTRSSREGNGQAGVPARNQPIPVEPASGKSGREVPASERLTVPEFPLPGASEKPREEESLAAWIGDAVIAARRNSDPKAVPIEREKYQSELEQRTAAALRQDAPPATAPGSPAASNGSRPSPDAAGVSSASGSGSRGAVGDRSTREEIASRAIDAALPQIPRVILLEVDEAVLSGWKGRSPDLSAEEISGITLSLSEPSVFARVRNSGTPHFGNLDSEDWPLPFRALFGNVPPVCAVFPIRVLERICALLYADRLGSPMLYEDFPAIARTVGTMARALSRELARQTSVAPVGSS